MRFKLAGAALALALALPSLAVESPLGPVNQPLWLRQSRISPDGSQVAFTFQGNLYVVPAAGGPARLLVAQGHHVSAPVWSPDGRLLAFAADTFGNKDVFLVSADGGPSRRLTRHSAAETPIAFTPDGREVLFSAQRQDAPTSMAFPSPAMGELYRVGIEEGRRPVRVFSEPALAGQFNKAGTQLVYEDWKGYESDQRKHHVSPVAHDVWLWDARTGQHRKLTNSGGENRNPVWSPDEQSIYYLSEKSGSFNVWKMPVGQPEAARQITQFTKHPVRFLSVAANGTLSFGFDGELYTMAGDTAAPRKLTLSIGADALAPRVQTLKLTTGVTDMAVNPDGSEVAIVVRGQVFVTSAEFGNTRRITTGPGQKRSVSFSPDGRKLLYACEEGGQWSLCEATLEGDKKQVPSFFNAPRVSTRVLLKNAHQNFQPRYSPDGKQVAYLKDRAALHVLDLASGKTREVLSSDWNYSYEDGDQWFEWAPDGKQLLVQFIDRNRWSQEVGIVAADGSGKLRNLTQSGYEDFRPVFARQGQMVLWASDRQGLHGHGGGARNDVDVFGMFLTRAAFDRYQLDKAEFAQLKAREEDEKKDEKKDEGKKDDDKKDAKAGDGKADKKSDKKTDKKDEPAPKPVVVETEGLDDRVARLSTASGDIRDYALTPDGEQLFYVAKVDDGFELWQVRLREKDGRRVASLPAGRVESVSLALDAKGANGFVMAGGQVHKFKVPGDDGKGEVKTEGVKFTAELTVDRPAEWAQMFEHAWRQTREKLYVSDLGGVDWAGYREVYQRQLPFVADGQDFAELLSEMLGELNVSHTGAGYRPEPRGDATASLGVFYDDAYTGAGAKLAEVIAGGPLDTAANQVRAGMVIESIDGTTIAAGAEFDSLLNQKAGQQVVLGVRDPATGKRFEQTLKAISRSAENELLYKRWVKAERALVDKLSGGRLGYVHVRGMDDGSYRQTFSDALGRASGRQGLIVDTRFNGGGNLHDELATLLSGKQYLEFVPRGQSMGWEPVSKWTQRSAVLISESNYSDAHLFPWTYKHLGLGKLIGMPVAGTGTAVWWETMQDGATTFGIPQVGFRARTGEYMERTLITPDVVVPHDKARLDAGQDLQLEAAVKSLLAQ